MEMVLEFSAKSDPELRPVVAQLHYKIDLWIEIPLLCGVLATGGLLLDFDRISGVYAIKLAAGLLAILVNFLCVIPVVKRKQLADRGWEPAAGRYSRHIFAAFWISLAAGGTALVLGLSTLS